MTYLTKCKCHSVSIFVRKAENTDDTCRVISKNLKYVNKSKYTSINALLNRTSLLLKLVLTLYSFYKTTGQMVFSSQIAMT